jgi:hypothetical protein
MSSAISARQQRLVAQPSGNRCAFGKCRRILVSQGPKGTAPVFVGELAHIYGEKPGSARYDPVMTAKQRNSADNLMLVCLEHHTIIDGQSNNFSAETLLQMKADHEQWVDSKLTEASTVVTFVELEAVTRGLLGADQPETEDLTLTPPREKMAKNRLGPRVQRLIAIGMVNSGQVGAYIQAVEGVDSSFGNRLTEGFVDTYNSFRDRGLDGDELFFAMHSFSAQESTQFDRQAAGLSVVTYLFEKCELFER